jgi:hypothetical protein
MRGKRKACSLTERTTIRSGARSPRARRLARMRSLRNRIEKLESGWTQAAEGGIQLFVYRAGMELALDGNRCVEVLREAGFLRSGPFLSVIRLLDVPWGWMPAPWKHISEPTAPKSAGLVLGTSRVRLRGLPENSIFVGAASCDLFLSACRVPTFHPRARAGSALGIRFRGLRAQRQTTPNCRPSLLAPPARGRPFLRDT